MDKRTAVANGPEIVKRRKKKGWTAEQLAERAELDPRTITEAEASGRLFLRTFAKLASAF